MRRMKACERTKGVDGLARELIGGSDNCRLGDTGMQDEGALDLGG